MQQRTAQIISPDGEVVGDIYKIIEQPEQQPTFLPGKSFRVFTSSEKREKMKKARLTGTERELLDLALSKVINNTGRIDLNPTLTAREHGCGRNTVYLFIKKMIDNQLFLRTDGDLFINPHFFWVGSNEECIKNRQHLRVVASNGKLS